MTAVLIDTKSQEWREILAGAVAAGQLLFKIRGNLLDFLRDASNDALAKITELDCSGLYMSDEGAAALAVAAHLVNLTKLGLGFNMIGPEGATALAGAAHLVNLTSLDLATNKIGPEGATALAGAAHLVNLTKLGLGFNDIGSKGTTALAGATYLGSLTTLDLDHNKIGPEGAMALARAAHLVNLTTLDLGYNKIGPAGATALAGAAHLVNLTKLHLGGNKIGPEGATALAGAANLGSLTTLSLIANEIGPEGATALAGAAHLGSLTTLGLATNEIGPEGATALAGAAHLVNLTMLDLAHNEIGSKGTTALAGAAHLGSLTSLRLDHNKIGPEGATALAGAAHLVNLTTLDLGGNKIGPKGATALAGAAHFGSLTALGLGFNEIGDAEAATILLSPQLLRLEKCELAENALTAPENIQDDVDALRRHYRLTQAIRRSPNKRVRAILLGAPAAGKSRIARLLAEAPETAPTRTLGIDPHSKPYPNIVCEVDGKRELHDLNLDIWDIGGQSLQQMMHGLFLRQSQINLLVMRDASEREEVRAWLDQLMHQTTSGNSNCAALVPVINGFPRDSQAQMQETKTALDKLLERHGSLMPIQPVAAITTISDKNDALTRSLLDNKITAALFAIRLTTYFEPVARLSPLIESGLAEPCYDMRDLRRLLLANSSFQQEHGLLTQALLAAEGASSEPISAEQFAGMLITYLEQAGVVAVFRRDGDGIYDGLVVRDAFWIQKGLYSLVPPLPVEDDEPSPVRDAFAGSLRRPSAKERLPGIFTEKEIRPLWSALGIADADHGLLLKILTRPELGQVILLDEAVHHDQRRFFVPAYLEEIGEETEEQTLDRLAEGLIQSSFASCWSLPDGVHWPAYFIYRLMVTIHGTAVETLNREWERRGEPTCGAFVLSDYGQRRCTIRHDQLLPGVALQLLFANEKIWCLAIPDRSFAERRDAERVLEALETLIRIALGNIFRSDPGIIRSLACPRCINDLRVAPDADQRRRRLRTLGSFEFKLVTHRDAAPTLTCARSHKLRPADILEPNHSVVEPVSNHIDYSVVRRATCQIAVFLYLGGMAKFSATSASAAVGGSQFYLTAKDLDDARAPAAEGIIRTGNFTRDWIPTRDTVYGDSHRTIIGWCRYLARSSLVVRQICRITDPDALSEIDLCRAFMEGAGRVYTDPDQFIASWPTLMGYGKPPTPIHPTKSFLEKLQAQEEGHYDPILEHFGLGADGARPKRTTKHRVESKPRTARKKKEQDDVP